MGAWGSAPGVEAFIGIVQDALAQIIKDPLLICVRGTVGTLLARTEIRQGS